MEESNELPLYVRARRREPRTRNVQTTEGIAVRLPISRVLPRVYAFLLDNVFIGLGTAVVLFAVGLLAQFNAGAGFVVLLGLVAVFLLRNFYFMGFELYGQGRTPGKKAFGLRVVSRDGRPLTADQLFVRNVTRDVETFLPLVAAIAPEAFFPNAGGWAALASTVWLLVFALLPLFNRERLRAGDLLANTMVVSTSERRTLTDDVAIGTWMRVKNERPVYDFRAEQLDMYGIFELQVLEDILRPSAQGLDQEVLHKVARQIQYKIGWRDPDVQNWQFLQDFYSALRARLERKVLLGERQEMKKPGILPPTRSVQMVANRASGSFPSLESAEQGN